MSEEPSLRDEFGLRMGKFFIFLGFLLFILFALTDQAKNPNFDYFFASVFSIAIGVYLRRSAPKPPPADRFRTVRKWRAKRQAKKSPRK